MVWKFYSFINKIFYFLCVYYWLNYRNFRLGIIYFLFYYCRSYKLSVFLVAWYINSLFFLFMFNYMCVLFFYNYFYVYNRSFRLSEFSVVWLIRSFRILRRRWSRSEILWFRLLSRCTRRSFRSFCLYLLRYIIFLILGIFLRYF